MFPLIMAAGAAIGGLSTLMQGNKQAAALRGQKNNAWQQYLVNKQFADTQFGINKGEALAALGIQQGRLREDVNAGMANFNTGLLGQAYGIQDAQMNLAGQLGAYEAARGASGARGNEASGLAKAYAQASFDRSLGLQYDQNKQALEGMVTGANRGARDIGRERESWEEGGYRTRLYDAESERNRKLAELGQAGYDSAISAAKPGVLDFLSGGLMGASAGLSLYSGINNAMQYGGQAAAPYAGLENPMNLGGAQPQFSLTPGMGNSFNSLGYDRYALSYNPLGLRY